MKKPKLPADSAERPLSVLKAPWLLAYRYLGVRIQRSLPYFQDLGVTMQRAALKISLQSYVSMMLLLSGVSTVASFGITVGVLVIIRIGVGLAIMFSFGIALLLGVAVFSLLYFMPSLLASTRRRKMDFELPYVASHLSILAAAGIPPRACSCYSKTPEQLPRLHPTRMR